MGKVGGARTSEKYGHDFYVKMGKLSAQSKFKMKYPKELKQQIAESDTGNLSDTEKYILEKRFGKEFISLADLGKELNLSRERVRIIQKNALEKIN